MEYFVYCSDGIEKLHVRTTDTEYILLYSTQQYKSLMN